MGLPTTSNPSTLPAWALAGLAVLAVLAVVQITLAVVASLDLYPRAATTGFNRAADQQVQQLWLPRPVICLAPQWN